MKKIIYVYDTCTINVFEEQIGIDMLVTAIGDSLDGRITFYEDEYANPQTCSVRTFDVQYKVANVDISLDSSDALISFISEILGWTYDDYGVYSKFYVVDNVKN